MNEPEDVKEESSNNLFDTGIATKKEMEFLAKKIGAKKSKSTKEYTTTSLSHVAISYTTLTEQGLTAKTIATILNKDEESNTNSTIQRLAAFVLLQEKKIILSEFAKLLQEKKAWRKFIEAYYEEINNPFLKRDYLFYYWKDSYIAFGKFELSYRNNNLQEAKAKICFWDYNQSEGFFKVENSEDKTQFHPLHYSLTNFSFNLQYEHWQFSNFILHDAHQFLTHEISFATFNASFTPKSSPSVGLAMFIYYADIDRQISKLRQNRKVEDFVWRKLYKKGFTLNEESHHSTTSFIDKAGYKALQKYCGNFYLISRHETLGYYNKAKLKISPNGKFNIYYADASYSGIVTEINYPHNMLQRYLYLDIISKRVDNKILDYEGAYYLALANAGFDYSFEDLSKEMKYLSGASARINSNGTIIARKEYLVASANSAAFSKSVKKISFANEQELMIDVKSNKEPLEQWFKDISKDLRSKEDNLFFIDPANANKYITKQANYADLYFDAFLFKALHSKGNPVELYNYFVQGILNTTDSNRLNEKLKRTFAGLNETDELKLDKLIQNIEDIYNTIRNCHINEEHLRMFHFFLDKINDIEIIRDSNNLIYTALNAIIEQIRMLMKNAEFFVFHN